jgi:GDPmannose 4,6-dehydratase
MTPPRALITGIRGQDGRYLAAHLQALGSEVIGLSRSDTPIKGLPIVKVLAIDLLDSESVRTVLSQLRPDQIFHLASQSSVVRSWLIPIETALATGVSTAVLLEAARQATPYAKIFVASSSEVFGVPDRSPQSEDTPINPNTPYGVAKAFSLQISRTYRKQYQLFISNGILYNHESPLRSSDFVSRKITSTAVSVAKGTSNKLTLGNLDSVRDWGYAGDFVRAFHLMLATDHPTDLVLATGEGRTVREWCELAFGKVGLNYTDYVQTTPKLWRPPDSINMVGDPSKAESSLNWKREVSFHQLVSMMVESDCEQQGLSP